MKTHFRIRIVIRILLLLFFGIGAFLIIDQTEFWLLGLWCILFMIITLLELIRFIERDRKSLENFLIAVDQDDFTGNVGIAQDQKILYSAYVSLSNKFKSITSEKEANHHFLNSITENSGVPMIAYREDTEQIVLLNKKAKSLLGKRSFGNLKSLEKLEPGLVKILRSIDDSQRELYRFINTKLWSELSIVSNRIQLQEIWYKLISMHNIKSELDQRELDSWQKLIQVITHEIKNSVIPISTMSEVIAQSLESEGHKKALKDLNCEEEEDLREGLRKITNRSKGLVSFIKNYSKVSDTPEPKLVKVDIAKLIADTLDFLYPEIPSRVTLINDLPNNPIWLDIDPELIEQVLINILKNAFEVLDNGGTIHCSLEQTPHKCTINIKDTGPGIPADVMDNIFVPFYTTKNEGSGIGLAISRQIINKHKGEITVSSTTKEGTTFSISLPKL